MVHTRLLLPAQAGSGGLRQGWSCVAHWPVWFRSDAGDGGEQGGGAAAQGSGQGHRTPRLRGQARIQNVQASLQGHLNQRCVRACARVCVRVCVAPAVRSVLSRCYWLSQMRCGCWAPCSARQACPRSAPPYRRWGSKPRPWLGARFCGHTRGLQALLNLLRGCHEHTQGAAAAQYLSLVRSQFLATGRAIATVALLRSPSAVYGLSEWQDTDGRQSAKCVAYALRHGLLSFQP